MTGTANPAPTAQRALRQQVCVCVCVTKHVNDVCVGVRKCRAVPMPDACPYRKASVTDAYAMMSDISGEFFLLSALLPRTFCFLRGLPSSLGQQFLTSHGSQREDVCTSPVCILK